MLTWPYKPFIVYKTFIIFHKRPIYKENLFNSMKMLISHTKILNSDMVESLLQ